MNMPTFAPRVHTQSMPTVDSQGPDNLSQLLIRIAQFLLIGSLVLAPLVFFASAPGLLGTTKVYTVLFGVVGALVFFSLGVLRRGSVHLLVPYTLIAWFAVVVAAVVGSLLSGNPTNSLFGTVLDLHTTGFLILLGVVMGCIALFGITRTGAFYTYGALLTVGVLFILHHILRIVVGADFLSFGWLGSAGSVFGSFNDLGLFLSIIVMTTIVALEQLRVTPVVRIFCAAVVVLALVPLMVINFSFVWFTLGFFSLMLLMYALTKDRFAQQQSPDPVSAPTTSIVSILVITLVFITAVVFIIGGDALGERISNVTGVSYIEVRPSFTATLDIARNVYSTNAFTGVGANNFIEAWRLYKDQSINQTVFWNTTFNAGNGYIPSWFITGGLLGGLTWLVFLGVFFWSGSTMLLRSKTVDSFWFFIGTVSFLAAGFIWLAALVYVPGPMVLLLAALFTGLTLAAKQALMPQARTHINLATNARSGLLLIIAVMIVIISTITVGYSAARQFAAAHSFVTLPATLTADSTTEEVSEQILHSYQLFASDVYIREVAQVYLLRLNQLLALEEPSAAEQQEFERIVTQAIGAAQQAITLRPSDPRNWVVLGDVYNSLAAAGMEGATDRAVESYGEAQMRDPKNPVYAALQAIAVSRSDKPDAARAYIADALRLKSNYTDAIFLLTQLEIAAGNIEEAVATTRSLIALEPSNAGRYYQLGVLLAELQDRQAAIEAFNTAIQIDTSYSNARYLRALQYFELGDIETAIAELEIVRNLNPDNEFVGTLIEQIRSGEIETITPGNQSVSEPDVVNTDNDVTTTSGPLETDLLTPVNFGGSSEATAEATVVPAPVPATTTAVDETSE